MIKTILFDIDDTLLDFKKGQKNALTKMFNDQGIEMTQEVFETYQARNHELWQQFEQGQIEKDRVLSERFTYIFEKCGLVRDGKEMDELFRGYLKEEAILLPQAYKMIKALSTQYDLYIVTNGVSVTQYRRLDKSGLRPYFKDVFVSEDTGYQKPMREFFDYAFDRMPEAKRDETIIVGDSLSADIAGGNRYGIKTCWYNPQHLEMTGESQPDYEIDDLSKLPELIKKS